MDQKSLITDPDPGRQFITDRASKIFLDCIMMKNYGKLMLH
jgi:hypothetical protein